MVTDAWEPIDFLAEFRERETCLREVTELLKQEARCETGKLWGSSFASHRRRTGLLSRLATGRDRSLRRVALPRIATQRSARLHRRGSRQTNPMAFAND